MIDRRKYLKQIVTLLEEINNGRRSEHLLKIPLKDGGHIVIELRLKDVEKKQLKLCEKTGSDG